MISQTKRLITGQDKDFKKAIGPWTEKYKCCLEYTHWKADDKRWPRWGTMNNIVEGNKDIQWQREQHVLCFRLTCATQNNQHNCPASTTVNEILCGILRHLWGIFCPGCTIFPFLIMPEYSSPLLFQGITFLDW
jgi:hypothetical protein